MRTEAETPNEEFSQQIISYLIELLLQCLTWNYPRPTDGPRLVPTPLNMSLKQQLAALAQVVQQHGLPSAAYNGRIVRTNKAREKTITKWAPWYHNKQSAILMHNFCYNEFTHPNFNAPLVNTFKAVLQQHTPLARVANLQPAKASQCSSSGEEDCLKRSSTSPKTLPQQIQKLRTGLHAK